MSIIKITDDKNILFRVWGKDYANKHAGKTYGATLCEDGWATVSDENIKFPKETFKLLLENGKFYFSLSQEFSLCDLDCCSHSERTIDVKFNDLANDEYLLDCLHLIKRHKASAKEITDFFIQYLLSFMNHLNEDEDKSIVDWLQTNPLIRILILSDQLNHELEDYLNK